MLSEQVGLTEITIRYHRPAVKGREGKIWGQLVPVGFTQQGFGNGKAAPWRAGANENTIIELDQDVKIEGLLLPKGKYGLFIAYDPAASIVIFSKRTDAWGSFFYDEKEDALRVTVKPQVLDKTVEHLAYAFTDQTANSAIVRLSWEKLCIPFKVEVDALQQQFDALVAESLNPRGFTSQGLNLAAAWTLQNNYQLEKGLEWAMLATGSGFPGDATSFAALSTRAALLGKLGKQDEAAAVMKAAVANGNPGQLLQYGRQLLAANKGKEALSVFEMNYQKNPGSFAALTGMARGWSANGDYLKALGFARQALPLAPNAAARQAVELMIEKLTAGKDVN